ncbi:Hypothetical predicted protein [Mytilus galloprovincialis]|uniref:C-type lectin domain-containing protein n=1 Tax=Mytilus galloprovincialis TaxID=29158 RepID=A0A8B6FWF4_MYTGA|nr:Hypothetical predicted protein [Mytilus galloprovincialis]
MKGVTSFLLLQNLMSICSLSLNDVCDADDSKCQNLLISTPGEITYGQCYRHAALRRLLKVSFLTCLKECMKTSTCSNVSYRRDWKMCDINGNINPEVELALVGKCARHNCKEGYKCALKGDGFTCEIAYCTGRPIVANAELNEPFGLSRDLGHGMMYMCMKGMQMRGKPFAVCRQTGIWKSMFICEKSCEKGWINFGSHCYYIGLDKKMWDDSNEDCKKRGSFFVKIDDESENQWLQSVMLDNNIDNMWIGANDIDQEGTWRWIYDNTPVDFTNWNKKEPNNYKGNENCADMSKYQERSLVFHNKPTGQSSIICVEGFLCEPEAGVYRIKRLTNIFHTKPELKLFYWDHLRPVYKVLKVDSTNLIHSCCALANQLCSDDEDDSVWLFEILDSIGANDDYRKTVKRVSITQEILETFGGCLTCYYMGSTFEGAVTPDEPNDIDFMKCEEMFPVIQDISEAKMSWFSLLIVQESDTPDIYVKLQLVYDGIPCLSTDWHLLRFIGMHKYIKIDRVGSIIVFDFLMEPYTDDLFSRPKNKPAVKSEKYYDLNMDTVISTVAKRGQKWHRNGFPVKYITAGPQQI